MNGSVSPSLCIIGMIVCIINTATLPKYELYHHYYREVLYVKHKY